MRKLIVLALLLFAAPLSADEGMWLFNRTPPALLKQRYGFDPTQAWLDHLHKASVRVNSGGSASLPVPAGSVLRTQRLRLHSLAQIATPKPRCVATGFH